MRLRTPLRQVSPRTAQWRLWRKKNADRVAVRCRGLCDGCGQLAALDVHHVDGRESEPFSSLAELCAGLCRPCHKAVTGEVGNGINFPLRRRLAAEALERLNNRFSLKAETLNEAMRLLKKGWEFDSSRQEITRL